MPRYPESHRQPSGQKKRAPAPKQTAAQPNRHTAHPQTSRKGAPASRKPQPAAKQPPRQQKHHRSLFFYLWAALAFPELILHLSTAKSSDLLFNSGLLLGPLLALLPAAVIFFLCTSLGKKGNHALAVLFGFFSFLLYAS